MEKRTFTYSYSAKENEEAKSIREKYLPKEQTALDKAKKLDGKVKLAGRIEALAVGIIGILVFGIGMCMGLGAILGGMTLAVVLGIIGSLIMLCAYPVFKALHRSAREKYVPEILRLTEDAQQ